MSRRYGQLTGRARRIHARERQARQWTEECVAEYLDGDEDGLLRERFIPIRSRSEFDPTAACLALESPSIPLGNQLELPLGEATGVEPTSSPPSPGATSRVGAGSGAGERSIAPRSPRRHPHTPVPFDRLSRGAGGEEPLTFHWRRFVTGCALGSAAAAVVLMMVYLTVG